MKQEGAENRMRAEYYERDYRGYCRRNDGAFHFVMRGLDPRIHAATKHHGLPGQARQ